MKTKGIICAAVIMILSIGGLGWAWYGYGNDDWMAGHPHHGFGGPMMMLRHLDLTAEQKAQVDKILDQHKSERKDLNEKMAAAEKSFHAAMFNDVFNEQNIRQSSKAIAANMEESALLRARVMADIRALLTPEQLAQLKEMRARHEKWMKCREECGAMTQD